MSYDRTYRRTTTTTNRGRRPLYAPPPPPGGHNRQHSVLGYWVPLITIGTIAVGGLAAWIWSERESDDEYPHDKPPRPSTGMGGPYPTQGAQPYTGPPQPGIAGQGPPAVIPLQDQSTQGMPPPVGAQGQAGYAGEASSYYNSTETQSRDVRDDRTFIGRMTGAIKRTPSPQQFFDNASKQVMGGIAAAGSALGSIMEVDSNADAYSERRSRSQSRLREEREGFSDHERWSEEADERHRISTVEAQSEQRAKDVSQDKGKKSKRAVAVVVSAEFGDEQEHEGAYTEHGSILSHLPTQYDPSRTDLFVLIYAPGLKSLPPTNYKPGRASSSLGGSYSEINTPAQTPGSELPSMSPHLDAQSNLNTKHFDALYNQALSLVSHSTQILPFTTQDGYVHMLRHLAPQLVYVSDSLSGREGETITQLKGWVGHTVLVAGDEGHGGLADTETETEDEHGERKASKWYEHSSFVGLGKEVDVVDAARVGMDWSKRVNARE